MKAKPKGKSRIECNIKCVGPPALAKGGSTSTKKSLKSSDSKGKSPKLEQFDYKDWQDGNKKSHELLMHRSLEPVKHKNDGSCLSELTKKFKKEVK